MKTVRGFTFSCDQWIMVACYLNTTISVYLEELMFYAAKIALGGMFSTHANTCVI